MQAATVLTCLLLLGSSTITIAQTATQTLLVSNRTYTLPADTPVIIDELAGVLSDLHGQPAGMQVRWLASSVRGGAPVPVFGFTLIGPVTAVDPLQVLGQPVTITGDTVIEGFTTPDQLEIGAAMIVAGLVDPNGSVYATLAVLRGAQGNKYLLNGTVTQVVVAEPRVRVGNQWVDTVGVDFVGCATGGPVVGDYLELRADSIAGFATGDPIDTITAARCATPVPLGTAGAQGALEGIVGAGVDGESFQLGTVTIRYGTATVFEFGGPDDLEPGADVSTEGTFIDATTFTADSVEFVRPVVRFEGPMLPVDVTPGVSLRPFGVEVLNSAQLRDDDGILANGLAAPTQVQVRGWLDRNNVAFATRVRERGAADANDVALRGPLAAFSAPQLTIQGLTVDTTGATFFDADGMPLTDTAFFADLQINQVIDIGGAIWNATTRILTGGAITLLGFEHTQPVPGPLNGVVAGTVRSYGTPDRVFADGFDPDA